LRAGDFFAVDRAGARLRAAAFFAAFFATGFLATAFFAAAFFTDLPAAFFAAGRRVDLPAEDFFAADLRVVAMRAYSFGCGRPSMGTTMMSRT
jgi:hypothetical protein